MSDRYSSKPEPCPSCVRASMVGTIRREATQPLPAGAEAPLDYEGNPWCFDCSAASTLSRVAPALTWDMARTAVGNDRQEQLRMPGVPMGLVKTGIVRPSAEGDFERHVEWLESVGIRLAE